MPEKGDRRPLIVIEISPDLKEAKPVEVPDLDELLGERITGMAPDARTYLKLQMLLRDQDFIGRMNNSESIYAMFKEMIEGDYIDRTDVVGLYGTVMETFQGFKESLTAEAEERGIPIPTQDSSKPKRPQ